MDSLITTICYKNGEIIDGSNGVGYNCPLEWYFGQQYDNS